MDYSFVRKLIKTPSMEEINIIYQTLVSHGIEVFFKQEEEFINITEECLEERINLYVSAADLDAARVLIKEIGLEHLLCDDAETNENIVKSEVEKAEEEFYRKHKQNQIFAWGVIAGVIIFMFFHFFK